LCRAIVAGRAHVFPVAVSREPPEIVSALAMATYRILCIDDEPNILASLVRVFRPHGYVVTTGTSGDEALAMLEREPADIVISDMRMPGMDGTAVLEQVRARWPDTVRLLLTGHSDIDATIGAINRGEIHRYIGKPWNEAELLLIVRQALERKSLEGHKRRLEALARKQNGALKALNATLEQKVALRTAELQDAVGALAVSNDKLKTNFLTSLKVFSTLIEMREAESAGHSRRVTDMARKIGERMGIDAADAQDLLLAGLLHDIGKIGLSDATLRLARDASDGDIPLAFYKYPLRSEQALTPLEGLRGAAAIIRAHRERFDGRGYPEGLAGTAIPLGARILAVAKDYDAAQIGTLSRHRMPAEAARGRIAQGRGTLYDPEVVDVMLGVLDAADAPAPLDMRIELSDLAAGMVLSRDLVTLDGVLLLTADRILDESVVQRIRDFQMASDARPLAIYIHPARLA
jgi:response regulator RpfG family c-di-GMP phosphodiesterase